jgi:hypothetical protein
MKEEQEQLLVNLFNSIPVINEDHLELMLTQMSKDDALYILIQSVKYSYHQGVFSIGETEVISKALRIISKNENTESSLK